MTKTCPKCGSKKITHSHSKNLQERLKKFLNQRPYRCRNCDWRGMLKSESPRIRLIMKDKVLRKIMYALGAVLAAVLLVVFILLATSLFHSRTPKKPDNQHLTVTIVPAPQAAKEKTAQATDQTPTSTVSPEKPVQDNPVPQPAAPAPEELIRNLIAKWLESWKSGDMETYRSCYSPDFQSRKMNLDAWVAHKTKIGRISKKIDIQTEQLQITARENDATVTFIQHYSSSVSRNSGKKTLLLKKTNGEWKINRESI